MYKEKVYKGKKVKFYGSRTHIDAAIEALDSLHLTGVESKDRLAIQDLMDAKQLKARILYEGNTVTPYRKTIDLFKRYNKSGSIDNLDDYFYNFLHTECNDIAHYDKQGYIAYYRGDFEPVKRHVIFSTVVPSWRTDLSRVINEMKRISRADRVA